MANEGQDWRPALLKVSPAIDRIFRFVEMAGVLAVVEVILMPAHPQAAAVVMAFGAYGAGYFLLEPTIDWLSEPWMRRARSPKASLMRYIATAFATCLLMWPVLVGVSNLAAMIANLRHG